MGLLAHRPAPPGTGGPGRPPLRSPPRDVGSPPPARTPGQRFRVSRFPGAPRDPVHQGIDGEGRGPLCVDVGERVISLRILS